MMKYKNDNLTTASSSETSQNPEQIHIPRHGR